MTEAPAQPPPEAAHPRPRPGLAELALVTLIAAAIWAIYLARTDFHVVPLEDVKQTVVAARQFAAGEGMTSRVAAPPMIVFLAETGRAEPPWPNALRPPLATVLMGLVMRVASEPTAVAFSSGLFLILSVPLLYLIAFSLAGRVAAVFGAGAYLLSPAGLFFGSSGLSESSTIFALAAIVLLLMRPLTWQTALAAGAIAAIGYLGRSTMAIWAIVIVGYVIWISWRAGPLRAAGRALLFCLPLGAAVLWWGGEMKKLTGEFGYSAQSDIGIRRDTGIYPGRSSSEALEHWQPREFILAHPEVMLRKYGRIAQHTWPNFITMGGMTLLVAFFLAEMVLVLAGARPASIHWLVYLLLAQQLLLLPLVSFGHGGVSVNRYLDPLGPIAATFGAAFIVHLLRERGASLRRAVAPLALIVAVTAMPTVMNLVVGPYHDADLRAAREMRSWLQERGSTQQIVASTEYSDVAWATGFFAVGLPVTPEEFLRMHHGYLSVDWVHLRHRAGVNRDRTAAWEDVMAGREELPSFEYVHRFEDGSVLLQRVQ